MLTTQFINTREASRSLVLLSTQKIDAVLATLAESIVNRKDEILAANQEDLSRMEPSNPLYDRLLLTPQRMEGIASDMRNVSTLPSPLGRILSSRTLENGLQISRMSVPFGVIGIVYEARPNVTFDVFSLCLKSGNACLLKGGRDADSTNQASVRLIREVLQQEGLNPDIITLLPATHEATAELLHAREYVDLVIPRGSKRLIDFVRQEASVPVIETGAGVCHAYYDKDASLQKGQRIVENAKCRRVSVCNALDCLLIHRSRLADLPNLCQPLAGHSVLIHADADSLQALQGNYPAELLKPSTPESYGTEFLSYTMALKVVDSSGDAIRHIQQNGSGHSECIITEDNDTAELFLKQVDAACVYHNAPTSFTDGAQFGLGAEIGISTQKLHARGPMALEELTSYKWVIRGNGQVRKA